jgi:hypothetical protein
MIHDVYVFGDSHWRVFFPFVNHGAATDNVSHTGEWEGHKIRTIDTIANELSGSTMWGLLNPSSRHGARSRILSTLDSLNGVDNVALVFGEVDARYHNSRYFVGEHLSMGRIWELVSRYVRFIGEDLLMTGRVRERVFVYHGFDYPKKGETLLQPGQPMGAEAFDRASTVNAAVNVCLRDAFSYMNRVRVIAPKMLLNSFVSDDGVHLDPERVYNEFTLPVMGSSFYDGRPKMRETPL